MARFKVRFPSVDSFFAAQAIETVKAGALVANEQRRYLAVDSGDAASSRDEREFFRHLEILRKVFAAEIVTDYRYDLDRADLSGPEVIEVDDETGPTLDDVVTAIRADEGWELSRGGGIDIAVVDTGIAGDRREFPVAKRFGGWAPIGDTPWTDWEGHGTMCACIAAATRVGGGVFDGVAPDANIIACKTHFYDSELTAIYDYLTGLATDGRRIVATNSFGRKVGTPPPDPANSEFPDALTAAINAGVVVFFSAGNNHVLAGGAPNDCDPTSIWLHKSRSDVFAVATRTLEGPMWHYSSRGPGQHYGSAGANEKPDVTAPTPRNGRILYGSKIVKMPNGWGTSGACPQAAGLAALLLARNAGLAGSNLFDTIRGTSVASGLGWNCEGAGTIDCRAALDRV